MAVQLLKTVTIDEQINKAYQNALKNNAVIDLTARPTPTVLYMKQKDMEEEWCSNLYDRYGNLTTIDYADIVLSYENGWTACTGTDCEWFDCNGSIQSVLEKTKHHGGFYGGCHCKKKHIFINIDAMQNCNNFVLDLLYDRYDTIYVVNCFTSYESVA